LKSRASREGSSAKRLILRGVEHVLVDILPGLARGFLLLPKRVVAPESLRLGSWAECLTALLVSPEALGPAYPAVVR
jgi:hypothetical protein